MLVSPFTVCLLLSAATAIGALPVDPGEHLTHPGASAKIQGSFKRPTVMGNSFFSIHAGSFPSADPAKREKVLAFWKERYPRVFFTPPPSSAFHCDYDCPSLGLVDHQLLVCEQWKRTMDQHFRTDCGFPSVAIPHKLSELDNTLTPVIRQVSRERMLEIARKSGKDDAYIKRYLPRLFDVDTTPATMDAKIALPMCQ